LVGTTIYVQEFINQVVLLQRNDFVTLPASVILHRCHASYVPHMYTTRCTKNFLLVLCFDSVGGASVSIWPPIKRVMGCWCGFVWSEVQRI